MEAALYSSSAAARLAAIRAGQSRPPLMFPRACRGSLNAFSVLLGPSPGRQSKGEELWLGGPNRPYDQEVRIEVGLNENPFGDSHHMRRDRWNKLLC